jgi:tetratricopeptide (TPR) repeat protein
MEKKIYLKQEEMKLGVGSTARVTTTEDYYQVVEVDEGHVEIQLLDFVDRPLGKPSVIPKERLEEFIYCPDYFKDKKGTKELIAEKHVQIGDRHFEKKEYLSADYEYGKALSVKEDHLKANIGKGKALFAMGKKEEARKVFSKISSLGSLFEKENKHIFNEFGIELRKKGMFEEATQNYLKALSFDPGDEALYYNLGRVYYEEGEPKKAIEQLRQALNLRSDFEEAQDFLSKIGS